MKADHYQTAAHFKGFQRSLKTGFQIAQRPDYFDRLVATKAIPAGIGSAGFGARLGLVHKIAVDLTGTKGMDPASVAKPEGKVLTSDTGELTWNAEQPGAEELVEAADVIPHRDDLGAGCGQLAHQFVDLCSQRREQPWLLPWRPSSRPCPGRTP